MTIGNIKTEALRLMFATGADSPKAEELDELEREERYGGYLSAMEGSIRRCYADLLARNVIDDWPAEAGNTEECGVEEQIAVWIPYWIAGELYREDEPELAAELLGRYERQIGRLSREIAQGTVYALTEV